MGAKHSVTPAAVTQLLTVTTLTSVQVIPTTVTAAAAAGTAPSIGKRDLTYGGLVIPEAEKRDLTASITPTAVGGTTICPTAVPASASACSGTSRYASACSCAGITKSYTTVSAPSTTVTVTSMLSPSTVAVPVVASTVVIRYDVSTVAPTNPVPTDFLIQVNFPPGSDANSAQYQSLFLAMDNSFGELSPRPRASGIQFAIDKSNNDLVNFGSTGAPTDRFAVAVTIRSATFIVWDTRQHYQDSHVSYPQAQCTSIPSVLVPGSFQLQCHGSSGVAPAICDAAQWNSMGGAGVRSDAYFVLFAAGQSHAGCYPFELT